MIFVAFATRCLMVFFLFCSPSFVFGQEYEYVVEKYTRDHGLPDDYIKDLDTDSKGNVWFLTRRGMMKFDGFNFTPIRIHSDLPVKEFVIDKHDNLWLNLSIPERTKLDYDRLLIYRTNEGDFQNVEAYTGFDDFESSKIYFLWKDEKDNIYFSYRKKKVYFYDGNMAKMVFENENNWLVNRRGKREGTISYVNNERNKIISKNIQNDTDQEFNDSDVFFYVWQDGEIRIRCHYDRPWNETIHARRPRSFAITSSLGDTLFQGCKRRWIYDFDGREFYYAFNDHLKVYDMETRSVQDLSEDLFSSYPIHDILAMDADGGVVWVATSSGLIKIEKREKIFRSLLHEQNISIREMVALPGDTLLVSTEYGFYILDHNRNEILNSFHAESYFYGLTPLGKRRYLLGGYGTSNYIVDLSEMKLSEAQYFLSLSDKSLLDSEAHLNAYRDSKGTLWVTSSKGIGQYNVETQEITYVFVANDSERFYTDILPGKDEDHLFFLSDQGLSEIQVSTNSIRHFEAVEDKIISSLHRDEDADSIYWLGSRYEGLLKWEYDGEILEVVDDESGLSHNNVHSVFEDNYGRLWLSTDYGISILHKQTGEISIITDRNGLHENEMNRHSYFFDGDSLIFYGGINGIVKFNPYDVMFEDEDEMLEMMSLNFIDEANGNYVIAPLEKDIFELEVARGQKDVELHFNIPQSSHSNTLRYVFSSDEGDWKYTQGNVIELAELDEGETNLFVSKKLSISEWSSPIVITIHKALPFYREFWFYALLLLLSSGAVFWYINKRRITAIRINRRIRKEVELKTQELHYKNKVLTESKKLNEQLFSIIGHDLRSPLISLNSISKSMNYLVKAGQQEEVVKLGRSIESNSKKTLSVVDRLLEWAEKQRRSMLEFHEVDLSECVAKTIEEKAEMAAQMNVEVINEVQDSVLCISNEGSIRVVLGNVLSNALKFSQAGGVVRIKSYVTSKNIVLEVRDGGIGMDKELVESLNISKPLGEIKRSSDRDGLGMGMQLSSEIIKKVNGDIAFESVKGSGTTVRISLPI